MIFDFGSVTNKADNIFNRILEKVYTGLSACLYSILSGIDLIANAKEWEEIRYI